MESEDGERWRNMVCLTGIEPATKRIQVLLQFDYNFALVWKELVNLTAMGSIPIEIHFAV